MWVVCTGYTSVGGIHDTHLYETVAITIFAATKNVATKRLALYWLHAVVLTTITISPYLIQSVHTPLVK